MDKTKLMFFTLKQNLTVFISDELNEHVEYIKFLGCFVDWRFKWNYYIDSECKWVSVGIKIKRAVYHLFLILI